MARQDINHGTVAGDGTGENLFLAFEKVNANFTELYQNWVNLAATSNGDGASDVGIEDAADNFASTNVESALAEVMSKLADTAASEGASLVGLQDSAGNFTATDIEAALAELFSTYKVTHDPYRPLRIQATKDAMGIRDTAGCVDTDSSSGRKGNGVTPGYDTTLDSVAAGDFLNGSVQGSPVSQTGSILIYSDEDAAAAADSGTGTVDDPYVIDLQQWINQALTNYIVWDDSDADYHVKFTNCKFQRSTTTFTGSELIRVNIMSAEEPTHGTLTFENCDFWNNYSGLPKPSILIQSGEVLVEKTHIDRHSCPFISADTGGDYGGEKIKATVKNCLADNANGGWAASEDGSIFVPESIGSTIVLDQVTFSPGNNSSHIVYRRDCYAYVNRFREPVHNGKRVYMDHALADTLEPLTREKIYSNCHFEGSSSAEGIVFMTSGNTKAPVSNVTFYHCNFFSNNNSNDRVFNVGFAVNGYAKDFCCSNIKVLGCYFDNSSNLDHTPGAETLMFVCCKDILIDRCWIVDSPEDAYEFHTCYGNMTISNSGGDNIYGQLVDVYHNPAIISQDEEVGGYIHHIYGECGVGAGAINETEAVYLRAASNYVIHDIYVDNSAGGGQASIVLSDITAAVDNIRIYGPLPLDASCDQGVQIYQDTTGGNGFTNVKWSYYDETGTLQESGTPNTIPVR